MHIFHIPDILASKCASRGKRVHTPTKRSAVTVNDPLCYIRSMTLVRRRTHFPLSLSLSSSREATKVKTRDPRNPCREDLRCVVHDRVWVYHDILLVSTTTVCSSSRRFLPDDCVIVVDLIKIARRLVTSMTPPGLTKPSLRRF